MFHTNCVLLRFPSHDPAGWIDAQDGEYGGQTIYFESPQASMTMEIEEGHS